MALEMTPEQESRIAALLLSCGSTRGCEASDAGRVWDLVRDLVLEEAAKHLEHSQSPHGYGLWEAEEAAAAVRALKG